MKAAPLSLSLAGCLLIRPLLRPVIVLQDLTYGYTHPCVMDLKMGTKQSTRSQSSEKKKWRSAKVNATTSANLGGIRVRFFGFISSADYIRLLALTLSLSFRLPLRSPAGV